jgi:hypothetical protein
MDQTVRPHAGWAILSLGIVEANKYFGIEPPKSDRLTQIRQTRVSSAVHSASSNVLRHADANKPYLPLFAHD